MDRLIADGPIQSLRRTWPSPNDRFISHSFRWSYLLRNNNPQFLFPKLLNPHFQRFLTDSPLIAGAKDLIWICEQEDNSENSFITALFTSQLQPSPLLSFLWYGGPWSLLASPQPIALWYLLLTLFLVSKPVSSPSC